MSGERENSSQEMNNFVDDRESLIRHDDEGQVLIYLAKRRPC